MSIGHWFTRRGNFKIGDDGYRSTYKHSFNETDRNIFSSCPSQRLILSDSVANHKPIHVLRVIGSNQHCNSGSVSALNDSSSNPRLAHNKLHILQFPTADLRSSSAFFLFARRWGKQGRREAEGSSTNVVPFAVWLKTQREPRTAGHGREKVGNGHTRPHYCLRFSLHTIAALWVRTFPFTPRTAFRVRIDSCPLAADGWEPLLLRHS